jgi:hypothetical protein
MIAWSCLPPPHFILHYTHHLFVYLWSSNWETFSLITCLLPTWDFFFANSSAFLRRCYSFIVKKEHEHRICSFLCCFMRFLAAKDVFFVFLFLLLQ